ncbi:hypothetical protein BH11PSE2_BH11PSE2_20070 [soil metagenome]
MASKLSTVAIVALVLLGTGAAAQAQQIVQGKAKPAPAPAATFTSRETPSAAAEPLAPPATHKTMQWDDAKGRWGLKLDVDQPVNRDTRLKDAEVGAYYRVTPSIRVGGGVGLSDNGAAAVKPAAEQTAPRVRLETALKF